MIKQNKDESRIDYLLRVLKLTSYNHYLEIDYDEATCDLACLAEDIKNAYIDELGEK